MVILESKPGRLANRVFYFSYFIANAKAYNYTLYNPHFSEYLEYFPYLQDTQAVGKNVKLKLPESPFFQWIYPRLQWHLPRKDKREWLHQVINIRAYDKANQEYDLNQQAFWQAAKSKLCWVSGWKFRDHQNLEKYHEEIKHIFSPAPELLQQIKDKQLQNHAQADVVVGVHIRRTDYADFCGGKYYFELPFYLQKIKEIQELFQQQGKRATFIVCSDETFDQEIFGQLPVLQNQGNPLEDLYTLAHTDYLLGPPSTFSMWASYWGRVPLCMLDNPKKRITQVAQFSPIVSMDRFENGQVFGL